VATIVTTEAVLARRAATWTDEERVALAAVVAALHPSARHLTDILDWLDDIAARDRVRPAAVLADPDLQAVLRFRGSAPDRLKRWKERLRRLRYPRLAAREAAIADLVRAMDLGRVIVVTPPPGLEGAVVTVAIAARSTSELASALACLHDRIARGDVDRLFALLDEA
jgi:hypothetical protein